MFHARHQDKLRIRVRDLRERKVSVLGMFEESDIAGHSDFVNRMEFKVRTQHLKKKTHHAVVPRWAPAPGSLRPTATWQHFH